MENASKALIMAGSILLAMLIIGAAVFMYQGLTDSRTEEQEAIKIQQTNDFNKGYTAYEKNLYGSELLSLVNRMIDYNRKVSENQKGYDGYSSMTLEVNISGQKMNLEELNKIQISAENIKKRIPDQKMQKYISLWQDGKKEQVLAEDQSVKEEDINTYTTYIEFKRKMFKHGSTNYDEKKGRIKNMSYTEITK